jgi:hypothetical protein
MDAFPRLRKPSQDDSCGRGSYPTGDTNGYCTADRQLERGYYGEGSSSHFSGTWGRGRAFMSNFPPLVWRSPERQLALPSVV